MRICIFAAVILYGLLCYTDHLAKQMAIVTFGLLLALL